MSATWTRLADRFNRLNARERLWVFLGGLVVIAGLVFVAAIDHPLALQKASSLSISRQQAELTEVQASNAELAQSLKQDPDHANRQRIEGLRQELGSYDTELRGVQQGLVAPDRMVRLLESMLSGNSRVRLVKLKTLPVTSLVEQPAGTEADKSQPSPASAERLVYKHGIELTVEGNYLELLEYQARLEKLPWRMFFARTSIDSSAYPKVQMTLTLYTLSLEEAWLVV